MESSEEDLSNLERGARRDTLLVIVIFVSVSIPYIIISDTLLIANGAGEDLIMPLSAIKGIAYVLLTTGLLFLLLTWSNRRLINAERRLLEMARQMRERDVAYRNARLESIGFLAAGMAHSLNNSLAVAEGNLEILRTEEPDHASAARLDAIERAMERISGLSQRLLTFSSGGDPLRERSDLRDFIQEVTALRLGESKIRSSMLFQEGLWKVNIDRGQMSHVVDIIITNALECIPDDGQLRIEAENLVLEEGRMADLDAGEYVRISFKDTGPGIPQDQVGKVFEPYYSTKGLHNGLGLTIAHSIVRKHGGAIRLESEVGRGTTVMLYLEAARSLPEMNEEELETPAGKVLWMDDEEMIRDLGKEMLQELGYEVHAVEDGEKAVSMFAQEMEKNGYDVVILDIIIPSGMGGEETLRRIRDIDPRIKAVVCSGYSNNPLMANYREYGFSAVLPKPFRKRDLKRVLGRIVPLPDGSDDLEIARTRGRGIGS